MEQVNFYQRKLAYETDSWDLFEAMKNQESIMVLDARSPDLFAKGHIAGAESFPHQHMTEEGTKALRKDVQYVVYCDGVGCNASTAAAMKMSQLGFQVKELIGGLKWWKENGYPVDSALTKPEKQTTPGCGCG